MTVVIHNPSSVDVVGARIPVPDSKFAVYLYDEVEDKFVLE